MPLRALLKNHNTSLHVELRFLYFGELCMFKYNTKLYLEMRLNAECASFSIFLPSFNLTKIRPLAPHLGQIPPAEILPPGALSKGREIPAGQLSRVGGSGGRCVKRQAVGSERNPGVVSVNEEQEQARTQTCFDYDGW
jgi:hypothetical protein